MKELIFYDVDGTLARPFEVPPANLKKLIRSIDKSGVKQVLCSGKSKEYLSGLARGLGLEATSDIIAENGGVIYNWRLQKYHYYCRNQRIAELKSRIGQIMKGIRYKEELKETMITIFVSRKRQSDAVERLTLQNRIGLSVCLHKDGGIDIYPCGTDKGNAIKRYLERETKHSKLCNRIFTCGDGLNDLEMLEMGTPISFNGAHPELLSLVEERGGVISSKESPEGLIESLSRLIFSAHLPVINQVEYIDRHWGSWEVLSSGQNFKVKKMVVSPGSFLSLQKHQHRSEHWFVFEGEAKVRLDNQLIKLSQGEDIFIPEKSIHQVKNPGKSDLIIIEVQRGEYLGEDDIVRF